MKLPNPVQVIALPIHAIERVVAQPISWTAGLFREPTPVPAKTISLYSHIRPYLDPKSKLGVETDVVELLSHKTTTDKVQDALKHHPLVEIVIIFEDWWHFPKFRFKQEHLQEEIVPLYESPVAGISATVHTQGVVPVDAETIERIEAGEVPPPKPAIVVTVERPHNHTAT